MRVNSILQSKLLFVILFQFIVLHNGHSTSYFLFNDKVENAYTAVLNLRLTEAQGLTRQLRSSDPDNLAIDFIEDYSDFLKVYLSEDRNIFKQLEVHEDQRLDRLSKLYKDPTFRSPYTKYVHAEILLHWGLIQLKFGNYISCFNRIKKAYRLLNDNQKEYPQFSPNLKSLSILHALLSAVPDELKWILKTLGGMEGNIDQAKFELEQVLVYSSRTQYIFKNEAIAIYGLIMAHFDNDPASAWDLLQKSALNPAQSPLIAYIFSSLALKNGDNDQAIEFLQATPKGAMYYTFPYLDFMLGLAKLRRLDADAPVYLHKYITEFKGIHFIKECYQKLAWSELLQGNANGYAQYMRNVKKYGAHVVDEDKQALRESDRGIIPQVTLLKARLLSDGGYYRRALDLLESETGLLLQPDYSLEANYRLGRIYHLEKKYAQAIPFYQQAIEKGVNSSTHYACASSLYIGTIYETQKNFRLARLYFQKCLDITSGDYTSSLHQKAKAGLNRLND